MAILMKLTGDAKLMRNLKKIQREAGDLRPFFKKVGVYMLGSINRTFQAQGRPKWKGLAKSTMRGRERIGKWPGRMLQVTGRLKGSIVYRASRNDVEVGTSVPYAVHLHFGTKKMIDRPFLQFMNEDVKMIHKIFEQHLKDRLFKRLKYT